MVNQKWLRNYLDEAGLRRIEQSVRDAELQTSGEIVPVVVRSSSAVALVPLLSMALGLLALTLLKLYWLPPLAFLEWPWSWTALYLIVASLSYGFGLQDFMQRWLIPRREQQENVERRALLEFYQADLKKTAGRTGVLLFVSLMERRAVVLADQGIAQHCSQGVFDGVVTYLVAGAREKDLASGFERAILRCGDLLKPHFPRAADDRNELKDELRIKS